MSTTRFSLSSARSHALAGENALAVAHFMAMAKICPHVLTHNDIHNMFLPNLIVFCKSMEDQGQSQHAHEFYALVCECVGKDRSITVLNSWGEMCFRQGDWTQAAQIFMQALQIDDSGSVNISEMERARRNLSNLRSHFVDQWHFRMLNDTHRNSVYRNAIHKCVTEKLRTVGECKVLDLGSGSGLLSLFAAQAGATQVFACESSPVLAQLSTAIIHQNSYKHVIKVLNKTSFDLNLPQDIPYKVDIIVTELMDAGFFGEGVIATIFDAKHRLLANNGTIIPHFAHIFLTPVENINIRQENCVIFENLPPELDKDQMSHFNKVQRTNQIDEPYESVYLHRMSPPCKFITTPRKICTVDFNCDESLRSLTNFQADYRIEIGVECDFDGLISHFELLLDCDKEMVLRSNDKCCWEQALFPVRSKIHGTSIDVRVNIDGDRFDVNIGGNETGQTDNLLLDSRVIRCVNDSIYTNIFRDWMQRILGLEWYRIENGGRKNIRYFGSNPIIPWITQRILGTSVSVGDNPSPETTGEGQSSCENNTSAKSLLIFDVLHENGGLIENIVEKIAYKRMQIDATGGSNCVRVVPCMITVCACAVESSWLVESSQVVNNSPTLGLDIATHMNSLRADKLLQVDLHAKDMERLSIDQKVMYVNLNDQLKTDHVIQSSPMLSQTKSVELKITKSGVCDAVILWYRISDGVADNADIAEYENRNGIAFMNSTKRRVSPGEILKFEATLLNSHVDIKFL